MSTVIYRISLNLSALLDLVLELNVITVNTLLYVYKYMFYPQPCNYTLTYCQFVLVTYLL